MSDYLTLVRDLADARKTTRSLLKVMSDTQLNEAARQFDEEAYRALYPDIDAAVRNGVVRSGFAHWREWGCAEGREAPLLEEQSGAPKKSLERAESNYVSCLAQQKLMPPGPSEKHEGAAVVLIFAPRPVTPSSGGLLVLHKLGEMLRQRGVDARLWLGEPSDIPPGDPFGPYANGSVDPRDALVIYPEIVNGNPLQARHVVRWLLNYPGLFGRPVEYSPSDLMVHYLPFCAADPDPALELCVLTFEEPEESFGATERAEQACYVIRKGRERSRAPLPEAATCLDGASFEAMQKAFKTYARFYSYDIFTFLSVQAAMAGAVSVVMPDPAISAQRWRQLFPFARYGVAYGEEEIPWAIRTRHLISRYLRSLEHNGALQVDAFIARIAQLGWWRPARTHHRATAMRS